MGPSLSFEKFCFKLPLFNSCCSLWAEVKHNLIKMYPYNISIKHKFLLVAEVWDQDNIYLIINLFHLLWPLLTCKYWVKIQTLYEVRFSLTWKKKLKLNVVWKRRELVEGAISHKLRQDELYLHLLAQFSEWSCIRSSSVQHKSRVSD